MLWLNSPDLAKWGESGASFVLHVIVNIRDYRLKRNERAGMV